MGPKVGKKPIYLDYNATTPIDPAVVEEMLPFLSDHFGNPSSPHFYGANARTAVERARSQVATMLGCTPAEIIFTSGGTESNNLAIRGAAFSRRQMGRHILISSIEHPAVYEVCEALSKEGFEITRLPVDQFGWLNPEDLRKSIRPDTILISVMHANNEIGTIQDIAALSEIALEHEILFHTDAAQSIGKTRVKVDELGVDLLSVAGHKLYAPKGIGALYIRKGVKLWKVLHGADHEQNKRPGTENVLEIVGLGKACELVEKHLDSYVKHLQSTRDLLQNLLTEGRTDVRVNGHPVRRLANTLSISFKGLDASMLLLAFDRVAASAGAACHSEDMDDSPVLAAIGLPGEWAMGTIRFSTGRSSTKDEMQQAANHINGVLSTFDRTEELPIVDELKEFKLTHFTHGLGCACKLRPQDLEEVLKGIKPAASPSVLVGPETSDDAAVFKLRDDLALVQTVDFFTPVVDDPYLFGAIAAANALSDIYAMGADPVFALNVVGFPAKRLPLRVLKDILAGASDKAAEAGIPVLGGHSIEDNEPKFGMVVNGTVHPDRIWRNHGAKPGDRLILTKPIGLGILTTALKRGLLGQEKIDEVHEIMGQLNRQVARIMKEFIVNACTDITGFGLLGHLSEMTRASSVSADLVYDQVPVIEGVAELVAAGIVPGGTRNNLSFTQDEIDFGACTEVMKLILADAQTSGGLLLSLPEGQLNEVRNRFNSQKIACWEIGRVGKRRAKMIKILTKE